MTSLPRIGVLSLGTYIPKPRMISEQLAQKTGIPRTVIEEKFGILAKPMPGPEDHPCLMGARAAERAIERAGIDPRGIDLIIYATLSPDFNFPGTGVFVQRALGLKDIPCLDIRQQCTGFIYGMSIADAYIRAGMFKTILLIGSEVHSTGLDISTAGRDVTVLFGDGAGAVVIGRATDEAHMVLSTHIHADGSEAEILWTEYPASARHPRITAEAMAERKHYPVMNGKRVFKHAVTRMPAAIMEGMVTNNLKLTDIDMMIPHQANLRINQMVGQMIGLPPDRMHNNIQRYGNTTAASIPICMHEAIELGKIKPGNLVCLVAFGAGLTWGSTFLRY